MATQSDIRVKWNDVDAYDPVALTQAAASPGNEDLDPSKWQGKANSFILPRGKDPGKGYILMAKGEMPDLDGHSHELSFDDEAVKVKIQGLCVTSAEAVYSDGTETPDTIYLVEFADKRALGHMTAINAQFNVLTMEKESQFYVPTAVGEKVPFSWEQVIGKLWQAMPNSWGGVPQFEGVTFAGQPRDYSFVGVNAWDAFNEVLRDLDATVTVQPNGKFKVFPIGGEDANFEGQAEGAQPWALEVPLNDMQDSDACRIPESVTVYFHARHWTYQKAEDKAQPTTQDYWRNHPVHSVRIRTGGAGGASIPLWDSMSAIYSTDGALQNAVALDQIARKRTQAYLKNLGRGSRFDHRLYTGVFKFQPGPQVSAVAWFDTGKGPRTEVVQDPLGASFYEGSKRGHVIRSFPQKESASPPDIGRAHIPFNRFVWGILNEDLPKCGSANICVYYGEAGGGEIRDWLPARVQGAADGGQGGVGGQGAAGGNLPVNPIFAQLLGADFAQFLARLFAGLAPGGLNGVPSALQGALQLQAQLVGPLPVIIGPGIPFIQGLRNVVGNVLAGQAVAIGGPILNGLQQRRNNAQDQAVNAQAAAQLQADRAAQAVDEREALDRFLEARREKQAILDDQERLIIDPDEELPPSPPLTIDYIQSAVLADAVFAQQTNLVDSFDELIAIETGIFPEPLEESTAGVFAPDGLDPDFIETNLEANQAAAAVHANQAVQNRQAAVIQKDAAAQQPAELARGNAEAAAENLKGNGQRPQGEGMNGAAGGGGVVQIRGHDFFGHPMPRGQRVFCGYHYQTKNWVILSGGHITVEVGCLPANPGGADFRVIQAPDTTGRFETTQIKFNAAASFRLWIRTRDALLKSPPGGECPVDITCQPREITLDIGGGEQFSAFFQPPGQVFPLWGECIELGESVLAGATEMGVMRIRNPEAPSEQWFYPPIDGGGHKWIFPNKTPDEADHLLFGKMADGICTELAWTEKAGITTPKNLGANLMTFNDGYYADESAVPLVHGTVFANSTKTFDGDDADFDLDTFALSTNSTTGMVVTAGADGLKNNTGRTIKGWVSWGFTTKRSTKNNGGDVVDAFLIVAGGTVQGGRGTISSSTVAGPDKGNTIAGGPFYVTLLDAETAKINVRPEYNSGTADTFTTVADEAFITFVEAPPATRKYAEWEIGVLVALSGITPILRTGEMNCPDILCKWINPCHPGIISFSTPFMGAPFQGEPPAEAEEDFGPVPPVEGDDAPGAMLPPPDVDFPAPGTRITLPDGTVIEALPPTGPVEGHWDVNPADANSWGAPEMQALRS